MDNKKNNDIISDNYDVMAIEITEERIKNIKKIMSQENVCNIKINNITLDGEDAKAFNVIQSIWPENGHDAMVKHMIGLGAMYMKQDFLQAIIQHKVSNVLKNLSKDAE